MLAFGITVAVCVYYAYAHAILADANAGRFQPRFLVAELGDYLLWSILIGCVFAAFDLREADVRSRFVDALDARPYSNVTMIVGRALGVVATMVLPALATVAALQAAGVFARWAGLWTGGSFEPVSLASFVLLDVLVSLFAWVSMVLLLAAGLRNRMAVLLAAAVILALQFRIVSVAPAYLLNAVSVISTTGAWASDIATEFANADRLAQRCAVLVLGIGCCVAAAAISPRSDGASRVRRAAIGGMTILSAGAAIFLVALHGTSAIEKRGEWLEAHSAAAMNEAATRCDVEAITGSVRIEPGRSLEVDIDALVRTPTRGAHRLVFSLNPGMTVYSLTLGGESPPYMHEAGLLTVIPRRWLAPGSSLVLSIRAKGIPDADFGYLDSAVDWRRRSATNLIKYLGTQASLFHRRYVALTPAVHWLPASGANIDREDPSKRVPDFFHLELDVKVPPGWYVAGSGRQPGNQGQTGFRFRTTTPVAEATLFAAPFERVATELRGHELELLISEEHLPNLKRFANATGVIEGHIAELLGTIEEMGLSYPERTLSLVEVPTSLRTYRGGWRMDALRTPGVLLLREEGLPTVQAGYYDNLVPLDERPEYLAEHLIIYFLNDWLGGNVFQSLGGNLLASTGPSGDGAVAVDAILRDLAYRSLNPWGPLDSSVWFTAHDFDTEAYFGTSVWEMVTGTTSGHFGNMVWRTSQRPGTWDLAQRTSLAAITGWPDPYQSFALLSQMGNAMEGVILGKAGAKRVASLLGELRRRFEGRGFTLRDALAVADQVHHGLGGLLDELFSRSALPGFLVSPFGVSRLPDDASGQDRYQVTVHVRNQEPVGGWVSLGTSDYGGEGKPVYVPSNSAVEIGLISEVLPDQLWLVPYLSLNR